MTELNNNLSEIHAVILAGGPDFGRCPLTSRLPASFWPVVGKPAVIRLIENLHQQGLRQFTLCFDGARKMLEQVLSHLDGQIKVDSLPETMPLGTAGCLREAARIKPSACYYLTQGNLLLPPRLGAILPQYGNHAGDLTMLINSRDPGGRSSRKLAGGYLCDNELIGAIPRNGYCDIKETLVPKLVQAARQVRAIHLEKPVGLFRDWPGYLRGIPLYLETLLSVPGTDAMQISSSARVAPTARLMGPLVVADQVQIGDNCVIAGPAVIGQGCVVKAHTLIDSCVLWEQAQIGIGCQLQRCLVDGRVQVSDGSRIMDEYVGK